MGAYQNMSYAIPATILLIWFWGWYAFRAPITAGASNQTRRPLRAVLKRYRGTILQVSLIALTGLSLVLSLLSEDASKDRGFQAAMGILLVLTLGGVCVSSRQE